MFDTIFGLPVHVLVLHAAVVLVPMAAGLSVLLVALPAAARRFGIQRVWLQRAGAGVVLLDLAALVLVWVAIQSGQELQRRLGSGDPLIQQHAELGDAMLWFAVAMLVATALYVYLLRYSRAVTIVASVLVLATAVSAGVWLVRVGHSGAEAVWSGVVANT